LGCERAGNACGEDLFVIHSKVGREDCGNSGEVNSESAKISKK
jgi:hypothetical protein